MLGNDPTTLYATTHGSTKGVWNTDFQTLKVPDTSASFHTYGVDWEPTTTTFYMDGKAIASAPTPGSMNSPMYMLLNLAVGGKGSWPGSPTASTAFPASLKIDYVRAYATANTQDVTGGSSISGAIPLPPAGPPAPPPPPPAPVTIGSGPDAIVLQLSEDAWQGDAHYTVSVDGVQIGGVLTETASHAQAQDQALTVAGNWGAGEHQVAVDFLNDAYGGSSQADRNLYVDAASYNGVEASPGTLTLDAGGSQMLTVGTRAPALTIALGSGPDAVALSISEDAWQGDARFTVAVDGQQVGGTQTAAASHAAGHDQSFDLSGNWGAGQHQVTVDFLNDAYGGSAQTDRNLYLDAASYNGVAASPGQLALMSAGSQTLAVGTPQPPSTIALGSGPDTVALGISEDAWQGDAQFTIEVDGQQIGGTQTSTALHGSGQSQAFDLSGSWGAGQHQVAVDFLNDAYGGTAQTDRNLYVDSASFNGVAASPGQLNLMSAGSQALTVGTPMPVPAVALGSGADTVMLGISEDAWRGDAQFTVSIDGRQVGGTQTTTAVNAAGQDQIFNLSGDWGNGAHVVAVDFLNDAYGGSAQTDRNLYVDSASYDGQAVMPGTLSLYAQGAQSLTIPALAGAAKMSFIAQQANVTPATAPSMAPSMAQSAAASPDLLPNPIAGSAPSPAATGSASQTPQSGASYAALVATPHTTPAHAYPLQDLAA